MVPTADADPTFALDALIHLVSTPSDDKTCPVVPKFPSPSYIFPLMVMSLNVLELVALMVVEFKVVTVVIPVTFKEVIDVGPEILTVPDVTTF